MKFSPHMQFTMINVFADIKDRFVETIRSGRYKPFTQTGTSIFPEGHTCKSCDEYIDAIHS